MKKLSTMAFIFCATILLFACNNEIESPQIESDVPDFPAEISFTYQGKEYFSACQTIDGEFFILDDQVKELLDELNQNSNLASFIAEDGKTTYYDSFDEVMEIINVNENEFGDDEIMTKITQNEVIVQSQLWLNIDINQKKGFPIGDLIITPRRPIINFPELSEACDRQLSSLHIRKTRFWTLDTPPFRSQTVYATFYTEKNYQGYSITFAVGLGDTDLKINHMGHYYIPHSNIPSNTNWNDKTRSFRFVHYIDYI